MNLAIGPGDKCAGADLRALSEVCSGIDAAGCVVVGDNPDADIVGARRAGCASILVLTGVTDGATAGSLSGERAPDAVAADPAEVRALLEDRLS